PTPAGPILLVTTSVGIGVVAIVSYVRCSASGKVGATTEIAALATFLLGALSGAGNLTIAGAAGVAVAVILAAKPPLERFSKALTADEVSAALELAVVSVIVLPLLPDRGYGPWNALNPREIWTVVVLVSALSFAGFVAMRVLGERRGLALTGAVGGLVSSTAVTLSLARRAHGGAAASAAVLASAVMCVRMAVLAGVANPGVLLPLVPVLAVMTVVGGLGVWLLARTGGHASGP